MSRVGIGIRPPKKRPLGIVDVNVLYHTLSEPARAEDGRAPFHTHPMPECHNRAADLAGHRPAVTFSGQSDSQHANLAYRRMRLTAGNLGRSILFISPALVLPPRAPPS